MLLFAAISPTVSDWALPYAAIGHIAAFFLVWLAVWLPIAIPLSIWLKWQPPQPLTAAQKLPLLASLYAIAPLILWGAAAFEEKSFADYGLPWQAGLLGSLGRGMIWGGLGLGGMLAIEFGLGWVSWQPPLPPLQIATTLLLGLWVGLTEELIFRGFLQTQLQQDYSIWVAAAIGSTIFALLHLVWEGRDNVPQLPGLWLMGMVLVLARQIDGGGLGLAWGLHAGWIWTIASLDPVLTYPKPHLVWITGQGGKPLAGLAGILFLIATAALLWQFS